MRQNFLIATCFINLAVPFLAEARNACNPVVYLSADSHSGYSELGIHDLANDGKPNVLPEILIGGEWLKHMTSWKRTQDCRFVVWQSEKGFNGPKEDNFVEILDVQTKSIKKRLENTVYFWISNDSKFLFGLRQQDKGAFAYAFDSGEITELGHLSAQAFDTASRTVVGTYYKTAEGETCVATKVLGTSTESLIECVKGYVPGAVISPDGKRLVYSTLERKRFDGDTSTVKAYGFESGKKTVLKSFSQGFETDMRLGVFSADSNFFTFAIFAYTENSNISETHIADLGLGTTVQLGKRPFPLDGRRLCTGFVEGSPTRVFWLERKAAEDQFGFVHSSDLKGQSEVELGELSPVTADFASNHEGSCQNIGLSSTGRIIFPGKKSLISVTPDGTSKVELFPIFGTDTDSALPSDYVNPFYLTQDRVIGSTIKGADFEIVSIKTDGTDKKSLVHLFGRSVPSGIRLDTAGERLLFSYRTGISTGKHTFTSIHLGTDEIFYPFVSSYSYGPYTKRQNDDPWDYIIFK